MMGEAEGIVGDIPSRPYPTYDTLSYTDFLHNHILPNIPFLLSFKATSDWQSSVSWRIPSQQASASLPNLQALRRYGHHIVPVANTLQREYSEFQRSERPLSEILDLWERSTQSLNTHKDDTARRGRDGDDGGDGLYVKDWHLLDLIESENRGAREIYEVPECFRDDWMNPPYTPSPRTSPTTADFRFCYLGPAGTFTPLHKDVYGSYSWSANIVGRKIWWIFRPDQLHQISDKQGDLVFDVRKLEGEGGGVKVLQEEGEIIWIPSGWYHQVVNVDFCISVNHNFCSSPTLPHLFVAIQAAQKRVEESISDILPMIQQRLGMSTPEWEKEWLEEVQGLLERDAGWGWKGFWEMIRRNILDHPAIGHLAPDRKMRNEYVLEVVERYRDLREWEVVEDIRSIVEEVERLIAKGS